MNSIDSLLVQTSRSLLVRNAYACAILDGGKVSFATTCRPNWCKLACPMSADRAVWDGDGRMSVGSSQSSRLDVLKYAPDALRREITQRLRVIRAAKGRTLVEKGSRSTDVFFLLEGRAKALLYSANGREVCVHNIGPRDMFGEIAVLDGQPRSASIVASSDILVVAMHANDFMVCLESSPAAGVWLARAMASTVRRLTEQVFELSALNVQARIHCELLRLAQKGERRNNGIEVRPAPTHAELATRIGTHREAVTRELGALEDRRIISYGRRSLTIIDLARLEQAALQ